MHGFKLRVSVTVLGAVWVHLQVTGELSSDTVAQEKVSASSADRLGRQLPFAGTSDSSPADRTQQNRQVQHGYTLRCRLGC